MSQERRGCWYWALNIARRSAHILATDTRYAARFFRRSPGFVIAAVLSIALGVGANSAVFTLIERLFLKPPPGITNAHGLRRVYLWTEGTGQPANVRSVLSWAELFAMRDDARAGFSAATGYEGPRPVRLGRNLDGPLVKRTAVATNYFRMLGVRPALGRLLVPEDGRDDAPTIAGVLSYAFWQTHFAGARTVLGQTLVLDDHPVTIVGVAAPNFGGLELDATDVWVPIGPLARADRGVGWRSDRTMTHVNGVVRLRSGVDVQLAQVMARTAVDALRPAPAFLQDRAIRIELAPLLRTRGPARTTPEVAFAERSVLVALLVLFAGCANLANLWLARLVARRSELAIRLSLGASRGRVITQLMIEALLLCLMAGLVALWIASVGGRVLRALVFPGITWTGSTVDTRVVVVTLVTAVTCAVIGAALPGWRAATIDLAAALKSGARDGGTRRHRLREGVLALQIAVSVAVLIGATLFTRSVLRAHEFDVGFDAAHAVSITVRFRSHLSTVEWTQRMGEAADLVRRVPGVRAVGEADSPGTMYFGASSGSLFAPGRDVSAALQPLDPAELPMSADAMRALGIRPVRGRLLTHEDERSTPRVVVVSESLARALWPQRNAIGQCLRIDADSMPCSEVVGITPDLVVTHLADGRHAAYFVPLEQASLVGGPYELVAHVDDPTIAVPRIRAALRAWRSDLVFLDASPIEEHVSADMRPWRVGASVLAALGAITLLLAVIGAYGVLSFTVQRRARELAIRAALGATGRQLARLVLIYMLRLTLAGIAVGVIVALPFARALNGLLFETSVHDVGSLVAALFILFGAAICAALVPAYRAGHTTAAVSLRAE